MPLILKGRAKKVIAISTGISDPEMTLKADIFQATSYSMSKAALNVAVAKFSALYREKGVLVMAICPGAVDTGSLQIGMYSSWQVKAYAFFWCFIETEEDGKLAMALFGKFKEYSPTFQGPAKPEDSVKSVLALVNKATVDGGYAGVFISHTEGKPYLWDCVLHSAYIIHLLLQVQSRANVA